MAARFQNFYIPFCFPIRFVELPARKAVSEQLTRCGFACIDFNLSAAAGKPLRWEAEPSFVYTSRRLHTDYENRAERTCIRQFAFPKRLNRKRLRLSGEPCESADQGGQESNRGAPTEQLCGAG